MKNTKFLMYLIVIAMPVTFCIYHIYTIFYPRYIINNHLIYWHHWNEAVGSYNEPVKKADIYTFKSLGYGFGKDKNRIYQKTQIINGVDHDTFKPLSEYWAIDKNHVISTSGFPVVIFKNSNPKTFHLIFNNEFYGKDKNYIYTADYKFKPCDIKSFREVKKDMTFWTKDNNCFYYKGYKLHNIDYKTFHIFRTRDHFTTTFAADNKHVYVINLDDKLEIINHANPKTTHLISPDMVDGVRDNNRCYNIIGKPISCSDSNSDHWLGLK